jgi:hypothetical protein
MKAILSPVTKAVLLLVVVMAPSVAFAGDKEDLAALLDEFLAGASVGDAEVHDNFWADNLVYTSSSGTRTDKATILAGMRQAAEDAGVDNGPELVYSAEEVEIDLYGDMAVVAFKLVGTPQHTKNAPVDYYFNTGTFLKRGEQWQAVAWQATRIPPVAD